MIEITTINLVLGITSVFGVVFSVFFYFKNPQIKTDLETQALRKDVTSLQTQVAELKALVDKFISTVNGLDKEISRLSTIIEERIPKGSPNLTPPGL